MVDWDWKKEYDALLRDGLANGEVEQLPSDEERRTQPRFRLKTQQVWIKVQRRFRVADLSVAGIAVLSDFPFEVGQTIHITLGKAFAVEAAVQDCTPDAEGPDGNGGFRISCQFEDETVGMQFLVMLKQFDELDLAVTPGPLVTAVH